MMMSLPPNRDQEWSQQRQKWHDQQIRWYSLNETQRSFYKPGMPFRTVVSLLIISAFLLVSLIIVWFSLLAGILLFICAGIAIVVELATGGS
jgi:hypothetical protein